MKVKSLFDKPDELIVCQVRPADGTTLRCQATEMVEGFEERDYGSVGVLRAITEYKEFIGNAINNEWGWVNDSLASDSRKRYLICGIIYHSAEDAYDGKPFYVLEIYLPKHPKKSRCYLQVMP